MKTRTETSVMTIIRQEATLRAKDDWQRQEDLFQEGLERVWKSGIVDDELKLKPGTPESWIVRTARLAMLNYLRNTGVTTKKGRPEKEQAILIRNFDELCDFEIDRSDGQDMAELEFKMEQVLTEDEWKVLWLRLNGVRGALHHENEKYSLWDIAIQMAVGHNSPQVWPINTVRRLLESAIRKLQTAA